jgi:hypothetical protein
MWRSAMIEATDLTTPIGPPPIPMRKPLAWTVFDGMIATVSAVAATAMISFDRGLDMALSRAGTL